MADKQVVDLIHSVDRKITIMSNRLRTTVLDEREQGGNTYILRDMFDIQIGLMTIIKAISDVD